MSKPLAVIVGATGRQGGSVVETFLHDGTYKIRAVTRNTKSEKALALQTQGVEVVSGDLNDQASIVEAFQGATLIFAVTDFLEPFTKHGPKIVVEVEKAQGINLARAAAATQTLRHYIWSTLPNAKKISGGKFIIPHFEAKNQVDTYIKSDPELFAKTTFVWCTFFASNILAPTFTPNLLRSSGKYAWLQPAPAETTILSIGDETQNVGPFILSITKQPSLTQNGRFVLATVDESTAGKNTSYAIITLEEYDRLWPMWGLEIGAITKFWGEYKELSWSGEQVLRKEDLGIT